MRFGKRMIWAKFCARTRAFAFAIVDRILFPRFELDFCREVDNERRVGQEELRR